MITVWSEGPADSNMPEDILVDVYRKVCAHPWWIARAKLVAALLRANGVPAPSDIVEVGCGWGTNMDCLQKAGYRLTGIDISRRCLEMIDRPSLNLVQADLNQDFPPGIPQFDAALLLDVVEHLDDDRAAICRTAALVRPGGALIVSVPALPELFSEFDAIQGHRRRYLPETLRAAFQETGFELQKLLWWGQWMVPVLQRTRSRTSAKIASVSRTYADYLRLPPWPAPLFMRLAYAMEEGRAIRGQLKTGTSLFAIGTRQR